MLKQLKMNIFNDSKYTSWYWSIVINAQARGYGDERHHIIPRSLGGNNSKKNLVDLTFREHFLVHWLLTKMTDGNTKRKMMKALHKMTQGRSHILSSWHYAIAREANRKSMLGDANPMNDPNVREKMRLSKIGFRHTDKTKRLMSESHKGKKRPYVSEELRRRNKFNNPMSNPETVKKRLETMKRKGYYAT